MSSPMMTVITVFTRPECHLCFEAVARIGKILEDGQAFEMREVDIESSDELLAAYLERIPVVEVDGVEVSELEFDHRAFRQAVGLTAGGSGQVA